MEYNRNFFFNPITEKSDIKHALKKVIFFAKISGVHPYKENVSDTFLSIYTLFWVIYFTVGIVSCLGWLQYQDLEWFSSMYHLVLEKGQALTIYFCYLTSIFTCIYYRTEIFDVIKSIEKLDEHIAENGLHFRYSTKWIHSVIAFRICSIIIVYVLDMIFLMTPNNWLTYMDNMTTYHPMFSPTAMQLLSFSFISFLSDHVRFLRTSLVKIDNKRYAMKMNKIYSIGRCFTQCIKISHEVNEIFSIHTLFCIVTIFYMNVVNIYNCVLVHSRGSHDRIALIFILILCISLRGIELWNITQPYNDFIVQTEMLRNTMFNVAMKDKSNILINDELYQTHIVFLTKQKYLASGVFKVDYTLIRSMIGALVTFFVILLQLDVSKIE